jgi:ZIP family zinc transporter
MINDNFLPAFLLVCFAGLATSVGSLIALISGRRDPSVLGFSLGFSAGVMLYVSFVDILGKARDSLETAIGAEPAVWITVLSFFSGMIIMGIIDRLVPAAENPHETHSVCDKKLMRVGLATALAIAIHNFPEGFATFVAAMENPVMGIPIAIAIAIHNIPEGISVSMPIYCATGSRKKAFVWSALSGVSEPVGAVFGYFLLRAFFTDTVFGIVFAGVAGVMVFISLDELLPTAETYGKHHYCIYGVVAGMAVMALSILLLGV